MSLLGAVTGTCNWIGDKTAFLFKGAADTVEFCVKKGGGAVGSATLGAISGPFTVMGGRVAAFQGFVQGFAYGAVFRPIGTYISDHAGEGPNQFNENARLILYTTGAVANFAVPLIITHYAGVPCMNKIADTLPGSVGWIFQPNEGAEHTYLGGMALNVLPSLLSLAISFGQYVEPKNNKLK